jgi:hypothetical protein
MRKDGRKAAGNDSAEERRSNSLKWGKKSRNWSVFCEKFFAAFLNLGTD